MTTRDNKHQFSQDEIIVYVIGAASSELERQIDLAIKNDSELAAKIAMMSEFATDAFLNQEVSPRVDRIVHAAHVSIGVAAQTNVESTKNVAADSRARTRYGRSQQETMRPGSVAVHVDSYGRQALVRTSPRAATEARLGIHPSFNEREAELSAVLELTHQMLFDSSGDSARVGQALDGLFGGLHWQKTYCTDEEWQACIRQCRDHRLLDMIHEDPFTGRAYKKPRGYAGDAELIDLIYGPEEHWAKPQASPLGMNIYQYTIAAPAAEGIRARRSFIADLIDDQAGQKPGLDILAIGAGHLREAGLAASVRRRRIGRFAALDADAVSLEEVKRAYGRYGVETVAAPFSQLITGRIGLGQFDLVYTTGLYDYLNVSTGRRLVRTMFDTLKPGGQLVVANFMPGIRDVGYMEAFMDWRLIYRTRHDMTDLTMEIEEPEIRDLSLFTEESRNIIFLRLTKI